MTTIPADVISKAAREIEAGLRNGLTHAEIADDVLLAGGWPEMQERIKKLKEEATLFHTRGVDRYQDILRVTSQRDAALSEVDALKKRLAELEKENTALRWDGELNRVNAQLRELAEAVTAVCYKHGRGVSAELDKLDDLRYALAQAATGAAKGGGK